MWLPTENVGLNKRGDWRKQNSQNEMWHWTNDEIGVVVQSWLWVQIELMTWKLCQLECLNGIQWSWVQLPLESTFYSYFKESVSGEYHMYQLMPLHSCDYLQKTSIKINVATDEGKTAKMKCDTEQTMKLEWLYKVGSGCELNSWPDSSID